MKKEKIDVDAIIEAKKSALKKAAQLLSKIRGSINAKSSNK